MDSNTTVVDPDKVCFCSDDPKLRREITNWEVTAERPIGNPSEWFAVHKKKPDVLVVSLKDVKREDLHATVRALFPTGDLSPEWAVAFVRAEFQLANGKLNSDWNSFEQAIGKAGELITVANLVELNETEKAPNNLVNGVDLMTEKEILKYLIAICGLYRILPVTRDDYRDRLIASAMALMQGLPGDPLDLGNAKESYRQWLAYQPYVKMMACVDMFIQEFPFHKYSQVRIGTIYSRFKDCSILMSTRMIQKNIALDLRAFAKWIWTRQSANEYLRITKGGEEMDNTRSYAMYFMDLGLSDKSPYSASVNPNLHLLYHTIGCCAGLERSRNARYIGDPEVNDVINNAVVIGFVMGSYSSFDQRFSSDGTVIKLDAADAEDDELDHLPRSRSAPAWLGYIVSQNGKIPRVAIRTAAAQWNQHPACRDESIGKFLYTRAQSSTIED